MPRRTHKKSRHGCSECKRRHVKCDESRPSCVNCVTARIRCPFEDHTSPLPAVPSRTVSNGTRSLTSTPQTGIPVSPENDFNQALEPSLVGAAASQPVNMIHMELILHWMSETYRSFAISGPQAEVYGEISFKHALQHPFLMQEILAMSALHLSVTNPEKSSSYHVHATQLQSQALLDFNKVIPHINETSVIPAFLFSSLIGLHSFCETFFYRSSNFNEVLDSLTSSIKLLRGVRSIIGGWWDFLYASELRPILVTAHDMVSADVRDTKHLDPLRTLIKSADVSAASAAAYENAIKELQTTYNVQSRLSSAERSQSANMAIGWLVIVKKEFTDLLMQRRPEALIILAYYAAILHFRKGFWAIGDAGEFLVNSINAYLGKHWEQWLSWPLEIISQTDPQSLDL